MSVNLSNILLYDVPAVVAAIGSLGAAWIGRGARRHIDKVDKKVDLVNEAVNNRAPGEPTISDDVKHIRRAGETL